ncbi:MAG: septal ring lytic transglycosylase RlpA family protein [Sulfurisoma sp.]|nr:septal ring lytic transglycosylase RlpA family protein [Sulfurisoma sp.]
MSHRPSERTPAPTAVPPARPEGSTLGVPTFSTPAQAPKRGGGYYQDDGPGDSAPENLDAIPDAVPRMEPLHRYANNPYSVLGRDYVPLRTRQPYRERGVASWYGRKFHGQKTSSGERYDMFGMTAAHPTLPIPSYVRVTNPANGKSVVVRVNDRGPFHSGRLIDLSYTAAWKLGYIGNGSTPVEVEAIQPGVETVVARAPAEDPIARFASLPEPPAAPAPLPAESRGTFVQLGAFGNPDNAEAFRAHVARELDWAGDLLRTQVAGNLHRVQLGPFASRAEADGVAEKIRIALGVKPAIVVR